MKLYDTSKQPDSAANNRILTPWNCGIPLPKHYLYVETKGSVGASIFHKPRSPNEILNDSDGEAINLSRMMVNAESRLRLLERYALAAATYQTVSLDYPSDDVSRALNFALALHRIASRMPKTGYTLRKRLLVNLPAEMLPIDRAMERLRGVQIEDKPTSDLLQRYDSRRAFFLCDERDRQWNTPGGDELKKIIADIKGKIALIVSQRPEWVSERDGWQRFIPPKLAITSEQVWLRY